MIYSFTLGGSDGNNPFPSLIEASDGNLYGTTYSGGSTGAGTVFKISNPTTSPTESVIYSFAGGSDGSNPYASVVQASDGNLYGMMTSGGSSGAGTVFKISNPTTSPTESVIYSFTGGSEGAGPVAAVVQASDGNLYGTTPTPTVSSINFNAGQTRANNAILPMVGNPVGSITVQCDIPSGTTNILLDVNGYFQ